MTKSLTSILLLVSLLLPALGGYAWLRYQKSEVRQEVEERKERGFAEEELVQLQFSKVETQTLLRWEHAAEFEYQGQMYDVVRSEAKGDSMYYWCFWDEEETLLNQEIADLEKGLFDTDPQRQEKQERLQQFYKSLYLLALTPKDMPQPTTTNETPNVYLTKPLATFFEPPTPPPRYFIVA
ncbi:MAG TPA: hypothetical protein VJ953_02495 [Saprospiraceae bacterium]|nr:hypothetical protein [Saprospiraceae bacterium]